jgi:hypothetical protein
MNQGANQPQQPTRMSRTNPSVMSAARAAPLPKEQLTQAEIRERLKSESANVALNTLAVIKEKVQEFRQQDRFFQYKAFIAAGWLFLSVTTFGVTCARGGSQTGDFGAKLVPVPERASVSIMNKSEDPWEEVLIVVKDDKGAEWRASVARVEPTREVTIGPKQLLGASGQAAPSDIVIRGLEMRTSEGRAVLLEEGRNLTVDAEE